MSISNFEESATASFAIRPALYRDARVLAANVAESFEIPTVDGFTPTYVLFSGTGNFYCAYTPRGAATVTAAVPGSDITNGLAPELNPALRVIADYDELSLVAPANCTVILSYFV